MKYYEVFSDSGYHSAFLTSFTFGAQAFEDIVLQRLRNAGCNNVHVIADQKMINQEFQLYGSPKYAGKLYHLMKRSRNGAFHPKLVLQLGKDKARLLVGSANLTAPGLAGNLELVSEIRCTGSEDPSASVLAEAMNYIQNSMPDKDVWFRRGLAKALSASRWLDLDSANTFFEDAKYGLTALVHDAKEQSTLDQFIELIGDDPIDRLTIISPYWDSELRALKELANRLGKPRLRIVIETERGLFPKDALQGLSQLTIHELDHSSGSRRVHGKLFVAEGQSYDHLLSGSLNCSRAALMTSKITSLNAEVGIYRRADKNSSIELLGLQPSVKNAVEMDDLPNFEVASKNEDASDRSPDGGALFLNGSRISWHPPTSYDGKNPHVELMVDAVDDAHETAQIALKKSAVQWSGYIPKTLESARSGIIVFDDGKRSAPVVICNMRTLPMMARPRPNRKVQHQIETLDLINSEDLRIIEILFALEQSDKNDADSDALARKRAKSGQVEEEGFDHRTLSYEDFLAGRTTKNQPSETSNETIFADRHVSEVSRALNRILGIVGPDSAAASEDDDNADIRPTEHGDENEVDSDDFAAPTVPKITKVRVIATNKNTVEAIVKAVDRFQTVFSDNGNTISLTQLIHLRAILQVILAYSIPSSGAISTTRVLPPFDNSKRAGWPRLVGKVLDCFLNQGSNPLASFEIPETADTIPAEIIDCWACVVVAATLASKCATKHPQTKFISNLLDKLAAKASVCIDASIFQFPEAIDRFEFVKSQLNHRYNDLLVD